MSTMRRCMPVLAMQHTYFPITPDEFGASIRYHDLLEGTFEIDDIKVTTQYLNHPALTLGYRLEADGATAVYCCDHEPFSRDVAEGGRYFFGLDQQHADFIEGADLLIHDAIHRRRILSQSRMGSQLH
jgi:hypothetical protein